MSSITKNNPMELDYQQALGEYLQCEKENHRLDASWYDMNDFSKITKKALKKITEIEVHLSRYAYDDDLTELLQKIPHLETLIVTANREITGEFLNTLYLKKRVFKQLTKIELRGERVDKSIIPNLRDLFPNLKNEGIGGCLKRERSVMRQTSIDE